MAVFQLPFAIKMDTQIGVSTVCHIPQQEYYNESKIFIKLFYIAQIRIIQCTRLNKGTFCIAKDGIK